MKPDVMFPVNQIIKLRLNNTKQYLAAKQGKSQRTVVRRPLAATINDASCTNRTVSLFSKYFQKPEILKAALGDELIKKHN